MSMPYLKKVNGQYIVTFLGRNGEPAAKKKVNITLQHRLQSSIHVDLITNKQGQLMLGPLNDVIKFSCV